MRRAGVALAVVCTGAALAVGSALAASVAVAAPAPPAPSDGDLARALDAAGGADVFVIDLPATPGAPHVRGAALARASAATVLGVLAEPARYGALIPSLVRSTEVARRGDARVVEWEIEVPLSNLSGTMEVRAKPGGVELSGFELSSVELSFVDGDLSPGKVAFTVARRANGTAAVFVDARLDVRKTSWFLRRVMARSPHGEPGVLAAATEVALRATVLRAEHAGDAAAWRPTAPIGPPPPGSANGRALLAAPFLSLAANGAVALVRPAPTGRLSSVSVATPARAAATLAATLADPRNWRVYPGWRHIRPMPPVGGRAPTIVVEDGLPFVDLDATWQPLPGTPARAWTAIAGATMGAWFAWDVSPVAGAAALTLAPRLEQTGSIARRFIEAEPLLEPGMSLALAFVDAVSATR